MPGFDDDDHEYHIVNSKAGFTTVVAVDFGPDGLLYACPAAVYFPRQLVQGIANMGDLDIVSRHNSTNAQTPTHR